jgi:hypothetical protein
MPKDQFLCDRLRCLLNLFKNNEEVHMVPEIQLDNILQWERPLRSKLFPLGGNSQEYKVIQTYLTNSAHCNNRKYRIEVIFGVENEVWCWYKYRN